MCGVTSFQRARSEEQREIRRQAILDTAASMLTEMPVADISLNELSRRTGLAKSNVLRYFESREAILLELLDQLGQALYADGAARIPAGISADAPLRTRVTRLASAVAEEFAEREMLCELLSSQASVLERNVSPETIIRYKRSTYRSLEGFSVVLREVVPELDAPKAGEAARAIVIAVGAYWTHAHPPANLRQVYDADPALVFLPEQFRAALERVIAVTILGLLAA